MSVPLFFLTHEFYVRHSRGVRYRHVPKRAHLQMRFTTALAHQHHKHEWQCTTAVACVACVAAVAALSQPVTGSAAPANPRKTYVHTVFWSHELSQNARGLVSLGAV